MAIPWAALATLGSGIAGGLLGGGGQEVPREQRMLMDAQRRATETENALQQIMLARRRAQDPLFRALQQMVFSRLPVFARQGINFDPTQPIQPGMPPGAINRPRGDEESLGRAVPRF